MRAVLDACVLYPTVLREVMLGLAGRGLYTPLWSPRLLEEWARAAARLGPGQEVVARGEAVAAALRFPGASVEFAPGADLALDLPDADDRHVLAAAIAADADAIITLNLRDFPSWALAPKGLRAVHPDEFLLDLWRAHPAAVAAVVEAVRAEAERLSAEPQPLRALMKRARLPRLGKALAG
ncbi:PIN domain-containing protein [Frigidibacter albus]|uniref:PIN domain-containing protein n=1 Tax=Frigidibacter albus TaxID=1465486 RepID=A0A6L8VHJ8_9RHOB|nr:PIN domain-containing protein [Frigidibacter albus]MZQ89867.1 PIN domain-containing protein [Frigidibacter albus]NBE31758.1 PIN domain-containing protein [Frigidibacter albus]GGH56246.1 PIN domain-containing protein [Frigidibacter albus]